MSSTSFHEFLVDSGIKKRDFARPISVHWEEANYEGEHMRRVEEELGVEINDSSVGIGKVCHWLVELCFNPSL